MNDPKEVFDGLEKVWDAFDHMEHELYADYVFDALEMLKTYDERLKRYEYIFDFLGLGFKKFATEILDGKTEAVCEVDERNRRFMISFKKI